MSSPALLRLGMLALGGAIVAGAVVHAIVLRRRGSAWRAATLLALGGAAPVVYEGLVLAGLAHETYVRFRQPLALLLTPAVALFLAWRWSRMDRTSRTMAPVRRAAVVALSGVAAVAAALSAAEPEIGKRLDKLTVVLAIDRSRSIDLVSGAEARLRAEERVAEGSMHDDDRIGTVVFGASASVEEPLRLRREPPPAQRVEVGRDATDIEAAIRRAIAEIPSDSVGRVVLLSDGVQTRGDALAAAAAAAPSDVRVDAVVLEQQRVPDVRVVGVRAPSTANEDEPVDLRVVTSSSVETDVDVRIREDGGDWRVTRTRIGKGEDVLRLREIARGPGLHRFDVALTAADPQADVVPDDNEGTAFVRVRGGALALVLEGDPGHGAPMVKALEATGFRAIEKDAVTFPADIGELAPFDLVVLSDIRASDVAASQVDAVASYARDLGGGLLLMGGDRSLGPGGYARTSIEEVSPVSFDLKQDKRRASLAEVIAIDYSGSMGMEVSGHTKLELANEAAARSASLLGPGDRLGVEHVDTVASWTVPMGPIKDAAAVGGAIRHVGVGGGGIYTDVALREGYAALAKETVNLRHLLLFADGDDAEQIAGCRALVGDAHARGVTTSVISLGRGTDSPELEVLSRVGGGRFYLVDDATKLPAVFTQETILAARSAISETPFAPSLAAPGPPTRAVDFARAPLLGGYVVAQPKPRASVLLAGPDGDPVLATWSVGVGRVAVFTSDYKDRWGQKWLPWGEAAKMFGQLGRDLARRAGDPRVRLDADASSGELHVRADVVGDDGRAQTFRRLVAQVAGPAGVATQVPLEATGAGRYAAALPLARPGTYVATVVDEVTGEVVGTIGAAQTAGDELRPTGSDRRLLAQVASMTGGKVRDTLAGLFDDRAATRFAYRPLLPLLAIVAASAMLLGVAARRLGVPDVAGALHRRLGAWQEAGSRRRAARAAEEARVHTLALEEQRRLKDALVARRAQSPAAGLPLPLPTSASFGFPPAGIPPVGVPVSTAIGAPRAAAAALPSAGAGEPSPPSALAPPAERPLTAVEKLALKRRERR